MSAFDFAVESNLMSYFATHKKMHIFVNKFDDTL